MSRKEDGSKGHTTRGASQTVNRALGLLKLTAAAPSDGVRLAEIAEEAGLDRATAHRLLASLAQFGFVEQDSETKRYRLGLEFFAMAAAASNRFDVTEVTRGVLRELSDKTGNTSFFCLRAATDLVCIDVETGASPIRTLPLDVGSKRPIGHGSAGLAALASLPDGEAATILERLGAGLAQSSGLTLDQYLEELAKVKTSGYAVLPEDSEQLVLGIAVALINRRGRPQGTLSVTGLARLLPLVEQEEIAKELLAQARHVEDAMWRLPDDKRHRKTWRAGE